MNIRIAKKPAQGRVTAPPSKSMAHRLLICAALAEGVSTVQNVSFSRDILATVEALKALGATFLIDGSTVTVTGCGGNPLATSPLPCDESGSTLRFLLPLTLLSGKGATLLGSPRLIERGVGIYQTLFAKQGVDFSISENQITVNGRLTPSDFSLFGGVSSQFVSGLLFALPLLDHDSTVSVLPPVESRNYVDMTVHALSLYGVEIKETSPNCFFIKGGQHYHASQLQVEGDWSNAAFLYALGYMGGSVKVEGLSSATLQGDAVCLEYLSRLQKGYATLDLSDCPDLAPVLFAMSAFFGHGAMFTGTKRLKIKESDRAKAMAEELAKMGASLKIEENSVEVCPCRLTPPKTALCGHNDHRIVMALSVLLTHLGGEIEGAEAVAKSYPDFFEILTSLDAEVEYVTQ